VNHADKIMGDEIYSSGETELLVMAPLTSRFVLYKNGSAVEQKSGAAAQFTVTGPRFIASKSIWIRCPHPSAASPGSSQTRFTWAMHMSGRKTLDRVIQFLLTKIPQNQPKNLS
jgi:hypothetical protein